MNENQSIYTLNNKEKLIWDAYFENVFKLPKFQGNSMNVGSFVDTLNTTANSACYHITKAVSREIEYEKTDTSDWHTNLEESEIAYYQHHNQQVNDYFNALTFVLWSIHSLGQIRNSDGGVAIPDIPKYYQFNELILSKLDELNDPEISVAGEDDSLDEVSIKALCYIAKLCNKLHFTELERLEQPNMSVHPGKYVSYYYFLTEVLHRLIYLLDHEFRSLSSDDESLDCDFIGELTKCMENVIIKESIECVNTISLNQ